METKNPSVKSSTEPKEKKYYLSGDEKQNVESRQQLIKQYQYLIHVINADIQAYMNFVVCPRVKVPQGKNYNLSADNAYITLSGGENEPKVAVK